jgi:hypothetical protein
MVQILFVAAFTGVFMVCSKQCFSSYCTFPNLAPSLAKKGQVWGRVGHLLKIFVAKLPCLARREGG